MYVLQTTVRPASHTDHTTNIVVRLPQKKDIRNNKHIKAKQILKQPEDTPNNAQWYTGYVAKHASDSDRFL